MKNRFALLVLLLVAPSAFAEEPIPLRAGPVSMIFDVDNAMLRFVRAGHFEVLRGLNAPVRIRGLASGNVHVVRIDGDTLQSAAKDPDVFSGRSGRRTTVNDKVLEIRLPAHAIVRIDQ